MTDRELLLAAARAAADQILYTPLTGEMIWLPKIGTDQETRRWNSRYAMKQAGCISERGYVRVVILINGKKKAIQAHQLAWFICNGELPQGEIDHINHVKHDNRLSNLRDVSRSTNQRNKPMPRNNTSGFVGVVRSRGRDKWEAFGRDNGKRVYLGLFDAPEQAAQVAKEFRRNRGYTEQHGSKA
jgi:hypothetical protein